MLVWLDGRLNVKNNPQENFGRELMELFTFGVENYRESDVYAAARVFTGWNLRETGTRGSPSANYRFLYNAGLPRHQRQGLQFPDLRRRQQPHPGAVGVLGYAGRPGSDRRAGDASRNGAAHGAAAVDLVRERGRAA